MAACSAVLLSALEPGDLLVLPNDCYMTVRELAETHLRSRGVELRAAPTSELHDAVEGASLVWIETPSNPGLEVSDIRLLAERAPDALMAVDNTLATPLGQQPLELGAHFSVSSATKYISGHADLMMGHVAVRRPELAAGLRNWRRISGGIAGPFEAWLAHRSVGTLALRLERQCANALALAQALSGHSAVSDVRYPGLPDDPSHEIAARQMSHFGGVLRFTLESREAAERFLSSLKLVTEATSFGGIHSSAERRGRWGGDDVPDGLVRFSAGCEDAEDLIQDVLSALGQ
jgi:cystathionine gamma-lyase